MTDKREPQRTTSKLGYQESGKRMQDQAERDPMALVKRRVADHQTFLQAKLPQIERWVTGGVDARALVRFAVFDLSAPGYAGDKLRECDPSSILVSLLACAQTGLEPGALKGEAFLVPFAKKAQYMAGWKGYVKQARRSFEVRSITSNVVFENDVFDLDLGGGLPPVHKPLLRGARGDIIGAYAVAKLVGSRDSIVSHEVEWLDREDLDAIRKAAKRGEKESDAWKLWSDQMYRKSPIRRIAKRLPMGNDYYRGLAIEQAQEDGKSAVDIIDVFTEGEATRTETGAARSAEMRAQVEDAQEPTEDEMRAYAAAEDAKAARQ